MIRLVTQAGISDIKAKTGILTAVAHTIVLQLLEIFWSESGCLGRYSHSYWSTNMC